MFLVPSYEVPSSEKSIWDTLSEAKSKFTPQNEWWEDEISFWGPAYFKRPDG